MLGRGTRPASDVPLSSLAGQKKRLAAIAKSSKPCLLIIDVVDAFDRLAVSDANIELTRVHRSSVLLPLLLSPVLLVVLVCVAHTTLVTC
jgi:type I site-specific restriction endonuclease